jgi:hypothetical protein
MLLLAIFPEGKKAIVAKCSFVLCSCRRHEGTLAFFPSGKMASQQLATSAFLRRRNGPDVPKNQKPRGVLAKIPSGKMAIV